MRQVYKPPGHVGLIEMAIEVAKARHPDRWKSAAMVEGEEAIWNGLDRPGGHRPELIEQHLLILLPSEARARNPDCVERYADFRDAQDSLWSALGAGEISAHYTENDGRFHPIPVEAWRARDAREELVSGRLTLDLPTEWIKVYPWMNKDAALQQILGRRDVTVAGENAASPSAQAVGAADTALQTEASGRSNAAPVRTPRKRGPKGYDEADASLVAEMHRIITDGSISVLSILEAAKRVAPKAAGGGTLASRIDRLRKRYSATYPDEKEIAPNFTN